MSQIGNISSVAAVVAHLRQQKLHQHGLASRLAALAKEAHPNLGARAGFIAQVATELYPGNQKRLAAVVGHVARMYFPLDLAARGKFVAQVSLIIGLEEQNRVTLVSEAARHSFPDMPFLFSCLADKG